MLTASVHVGTENCSSLMAPYIYKRNNEGIHIINVSKTWEKLMIAARIIAAIPNAKDVLVSAFNHFEWNLTSGKFLLILNLQV